MYNIDIEQEMFLPLLDFGAQFYSLFVAAVLRPNALDQYRLAAECYLTKRENSAGASLITHKKSGQLKNPEVFGVAFVGAQQCWTKITLENDNLCRKSTMGIPFPHFQIVNVSGSHNITDTSLLNKPFRVNYTGGHISDVYIEPDDLPWSANMKRALASIFQINLDLLKTKALVSSGREVSIQELPCIIFCESIESQNF